MAERSTAAVDVADNSGDEPLTAKAGQSTSDGPTQDRERDTDGGEAEGNGVTDRPAKVLPSYVVGIRSSKDGPVLLVDLEKMLDVAASGWGEALAGVDDLSPAF